VSEGEEFEIVDSEPIILCWVSENPPYEIYLNKEFFPYIKIEETETEWIIKQEEADEKDPYLEHSRTCDGCGDPE